MAKTWDNYECVFYTENTVNEAGDTRYTVLKNTVGRTALINVRRALDAGRSDVLSPGSEFVENQVRPTTQAICYIESGSELLKRIMKTGDDKDITIASVSGDSIVMKVKGFTGTCTRKPANGLTVFDCHNEDGVLSGIHIGHEVMNLGPALKRRHSIC